MLLPSVKIKKNRKTTCRGKGKHGGKVCRFLQEFWILSVPTAVACRVWSCFSRLKPGIVCSRALHKPIPFVAPLHGHVHLSHTPRRKSKAASYYPFATIRRDF